ncbi:hypothetical protein IFM89_034084 [Coptis chinensis]|uniref:Uncharacterized protein n=1 Tax=Coptis chinensis TaxID=261450 RepID=A0A835I5H1_9MAGN|nr:hypothetical protein IFM89_034084 [Coptis chinensis]
MEPNLENSKPKIIIRPSVAYDIASIAALYLHSRAKDLLALAYVAASSMTVVVAVEEAVKQEAAKELRSLHS